MRAVVAFVVATCLLLIPVISLADRQSALNAVRTEKGVSGARWRANNLRVLVRDDGSSRNGFAEYLCMLVIDHTPEMVPPPAGQWLLVTILDADDPNQTHQLGMAACSP
ncbi:MAG: hypothetical protein OEW11_09500 [Nitrospirota bacterium]|nr:hypothetical protein [Nitrospirota bacterium]